jgi:hypothetical protein
VQVVKSYFYMTEHNGLIIIISVISKTMAYDVNTKRSKLVLQKYSSIIIDFRSLPELINCI